MQDEALTGGCFCGAIRFVVADAVRFCCICHCESCRRASGGAFVPWATFNKADFTVSRGDMLLHRSSAKVTRGLCPACGTSLTYEHEDRRSEIDVTPVSFDDPSRFTPTAHIWLEDKLPWITVNDGLPQYRRTVTGG